MAINHDEYNRIRHYDEAAYSLCHAKNQLKYEAEACIKSGDIEEYGVIKEYIDAIDAIQSKLTDKYISLFH